MGTDLSSQAYTSIPQQIDFVENLEKDEGAVMFFIAGEQ